MKVAVLADIHSNLPALEVVLADIDRWKPDRVIVAGDVINRGPSPAECWNMISDRSQGQGWQLVRGNHEEYVLHHGAHDAPDSGPEFEIFRNSHWTYEALGGRMGAIEQMPFQVSFVDPNGGEARVVHASMRHTRDGIFHMTSDDSLRAKISPAPKLFLVGHTHQPLVRSVDETLVVNVGSVGMPFDDDWRAGYARMNWVSGVWKAEIVRLEYDRAAASRNYFESGFIDQAGDLARLMLLELQISRGLLHLWIRDYEALVLEGSLSVGRSVDLFIDKYGLASRLTEAAHYLA